MRQGRLFTRLDVSSAHHIIPIGENQLHWVKNRHSAVCFAFEVFSQATFERAVVNPAITFSHTNAFGKQLQTLRRIAATTQTHDSGHAWIVPAAHFVFVDQLR